MTVRSPVRSPLVLVAAFGLASAGLALAQPAGRPGISIQYAQLGGATGGLDGRAHLPTTPGWVTVDASPGRCANGHQVTMSARARTGHVREVKVMVNATGPGEIPLGGTGCPSASIEATLEDGRVLTGEDGTVTIRHLAGTGTPVLEGTFSWTPRLDGHPLLIRGIVFAPAPTTPSTP